MAGARLVSCGTTWLATGCPRRAGLSGGSKTKRGLHGRPCHPASVGRAPACRRPSRLLEQASIEPFPRSSASRDTWSATAASPIDLVATVLSAQRDVAGRAHRKDPTDLDGGRQPARRGGRQPTRVHMPPVIQPRPRPVSIRPASFESLNPGRHAVRLRPGVLIATAKFFFPIFVPREVYGEGRLRLEFGLIESETEARRSCAAPASFRRRPGPPKADRWEDT
jgi:hypothetical protein